jgi:hypothetical protein
MRQEYDLEQAEKETGIVTTVNDLVYNLIPVLI